jgi:hypothetical protein
MSENAHDPPTQAPRFLGRATLLTGYELEEPFTSEQLAALHVPRHATYTLMRDRLGAEPLELIRAMKHGGYRFKSKRGYPGTLVTRQGDPVPERMSFRQIAPLLSTMSGVQVTYETVRRWWEAVCPGEPDEPVDEVDDEPAPVVATTTSVRRRTVRRRPSAPAVGDEHADAIRAATERAKSTNPAVPAAAFLPPAE